MTYHSPQKAISLPFLSGLFVRGKKTSKKLEIFGAELLKVGWAIIFRPVLFSFARCDTKAETGLFSKHKATLGWRGDSFGEGGRPAREREKKLCLSFFLSCDAVG